MPDGSIESRKSIRFKAEPKTLYVLIDLDLDQGEFYPEYSGLVIDESFSGCGIATISDIPVVKNDTLLVKIGDSGVSKMKVCWRKDLDSEVIRLGLKYL